jgi:dTDP-4-dehydrorhamnose 3,5-epimerase
MRIVRVTPLAIPAIRVITFARFHDRRGYFTEPFRRSDLDRHPETSFLLGTAFVQSNESLSRAGTVRGLHFQWNPFMGKLVRTLNGHMVDIVLDIRKGSPTYGKALLYDMPADDNAETSEWIWIPPGFAHGNFFPLPSRIEYFCTGEYSPGCEAGISPLAGDIDWSLAEGRLKTQFDALIAGERIISDKDRAGLSVTAWREDARSNEFVYGPI